MSVRRFFCESLCFARRQLALLSHSRPWDASVSRPIGYSGTFTHAVARSTGAAVREGIVKVGKPGTGTGGISGNVGQDGPTTGLPCRRWLDRSHHAAARRFRLRPGLDRKDTQLPPKMHP